MSGDYVPGEADWRELIRDEVLTDEDLKEFERFNPNRNRRFWWWVLKAFRELEDASGVGSAMRSAQFYTEVNNIHELSRQQLRDSSPHLYTAIKNINKAITRIDRQYRRDAEGYAGAAEVALRQVTRSHAVVPLLRPPIEKDKLVSAKHLLEKQRAEIDEIPKPTKLKVRENKYENVYRAIVHLAVAYRMSRWPLTFGIEANSKTSFSNLLSIFYKVAKRNLVKPPIQNKEEGFLYYARDYRPQILESVMALEAN